MDELDELYHLHHGQRVYLIRVSFTTRGGRFYRYKYLCPSCLITMERTEFH